MLIKKNLLRAVIRKVSRKHNFILSVGEWATLTGTYWDGGSRYDYTWLNPVTGHQSYISTPVAPPQFGGSKPPTVQIEPGRILLKAGVFCGKPSAPSLTVHPDSLLDVLDIPCPMQRPPIQVLCDWLEEQGLEDWLKIVRGLG